MNTLKRDWSPQLGIKHVLIVVRCLLIHPNPASALNEAAGKLLLDEYDAFANRARLMTQIHATPRTDENDSKSAQAAIVSSNKKSNAAVKPAKKKPMAKTGSKKTKVGAKTKKKKGLRRL